MAMLGVLFLIHCGLWSVASFIEGLWMLMHPGFGLLLSCFGHTRAKNNSELPCGLEAVFHLWFGTVPGCLCLHHRAVSGLCCCGVQWFVFVLL